MKNNCIKIDFVLLDPALAGLCMTKSCGQMWAILVQVLYIVYLVNIFRGSPKPLILVLCAQVVVMSSNQRCVASWSVD